jgi:hypothetical protein
MLFAGCPFIFQSDKTVVPISSILTVSLVKNATITLSEAVRISSNLTFEWAYIWQKCYVS